MTVQENDTAAVTQAARVLVLAPHGRDGTVAVALLAEGGFTAHACANLASLVTELSQGAGLALVTQEALLTADLHPLAAWVARQPAWSDLPFIVVTERGGGPERNPGAHRLIEALGNVSLMERPFNPFTLISVARTALRSRRRQYQSRLQLEQLAQRQRALEDSEARFRTLADNIPVLTWTATADGAIYWYNSRWYEYTGATPEQMQGWGWQSVHDPALLPAVLERWQAAITSGEPLEMVFPLRRADGAMRPFLTRVAPVHDAAGRVIQWFGTNMDITSERAAEAAVRASEERLRFALAAGQLGSWDLDSDRGDLQCSEVCKGHFGRSPLDNFTYQDLLGTVHPEDLPLVRSAIAHALRRGSEYTIEFRAIWPDGSIHWVEIRGRAVRGARHSTRTAGVALDITARKNAQAELQAHRERLEDLVSDRTRELAAALDRLQAEVSERERTEEALRQSQKMEAIGQLTGGIAHDFNNLLTGISGCLEVMRSRHRQGRIGEMERYIVAAAESVTRAASLTHRLLAFARRQTLERKAVNVNRMAASMEDLIRRTVGPLIDLQLQFSAEPWLTFCDANQLESALLNLCINARDAMPQGGRLVISTANIKPGETCGAADETVLLGQNVMLSVQDTGCGMSPETAANAFDPFFTTKPIGQGTGLGLSMVYGFVKQSDGHVRLSSTLGEGTTVYIYLPRHDEAEILHAPTEDATLAPVAERSGKTILVVEDEPVIRALVADALWEIGYNVLQAADGPSGLRLIQSAAPVALLLTDVGLPGMNGRQLADAARTARPDLKVLFITGYAHNAAPDNHLLEGDMQVLTKPFALETLAARVRGIVETS